MKFCRLFEGCIMGPCESMRLIKSCKDTTDLVDSGGCPLSQPDGVVRDWQLSSDRAGGDGRI